MKNRWSEAEAKKFVTKYSAQWGVDLAQRVFSANLIGAEPSLVLHGGGNTSVKTSFTNKLNETIPAIYVKSSGQDMAAIKPEGYTCLDLEYLLKIRSLPELSSEDMLHEFKNHTLDSRADSPSIETLLHAFIPEVFIDHTHADAILALTNQSEGKRLVAEALGENVLILDYVSPGFKLAKAAVDLFEKNPGARAMVLMQHGLLTWGDSARQSYDTTIDLISQAESFVKQKATRPIIVHSRTPLTKAEERVVRVAPILRGLIALKTGNPDRPYERSVLVPLVNTETLDFVDSDGGKELALTPPLTGDHLIRTKSLPLWIDRPNYEDSTELRNQIGVAINDYCRAYDSYIDRYSVRMPKGVHRFDSMPRVILMPGLGGFCSGNDVSSALIARDITTHTLAVKAQIAAIGTYAGISERDIFDMEYLSLQHAKLRCNRSLQLEGQVALVTGAAGAIGSGTAEEFLKQGCHVALTDINRESLSVLVDELKSEYGERVTGVELDVTDGSSVRRGFEAIVRTWGGVDLVIINAGLALVSSLEEMSLDSFRKLQQVNTEGTLLMLSESARHFRLQGTGGDIVLISTKNVFSPGARFGAYSATKTAAHQLARIASLEFAEIDVRVNMVSPDAVFSHGDRKSGLWAEVGPDRMAARGLDPQGLEEYYRNRNILKARVTAQHVARAALFFATRQTPTTGASLPVDGGLPDATPR